MNVSSHWIAARSWKICSARSCFSAVKLAIVDVDVDGRLTDDILENVSVLLGDTRNKQIEILE